MCLRYSSRVVAPTRCRSPRAKDGFRIWAASLAPWPVAPAPMMVCNSSMKRTTWGRFFTSLSTPCILSSNSPWYLAPASRLVISSETIRLFAIEEGTSPFTIRTASPSRMAVLPTPASPISIGLFLRRRDKICRVWRISSSRPITGSSKFCLASLVKSMPYLSRNSPSGIEEGSRKMLPSGWEKKRTGTLLTGLGLRMAGSRRAAIRDARASVAILLRLVTRRYPRRHARVA
mmetsp:Transcript_20247/g.46972  ORF Transcript_20247/g.46972 Transcript_20247/m.46972 type:complete len:232 (-) Transcript_20247:15-710(-)